jgi:hypothetical protein
MWQDGEKASISSVVMMENNDISVEKISYI